MKKVIFVLAIIMIILTPSIISDKEIINNKQYNNSNYSCQQVNLKDTLKGKKLSILGDSISTYDGYSNNPNIYNMSTLNNKYYPKGEVNNVEETWWMQFAISTGMSVLVNNSYSGSRVYATSSNVDYYYQPAGFQDLRAKNLHNKSGINPDVIAIYMGTNDFRQSVELGTHDDTSYNIIKNNNGTYSYETPKSFVDAYIIMLHKIKTKYPNAEIFCFTLPKNSSDHSDETLQNYNVIIEEIAQHFGVNIVNLYDSEIILTNTYYLDLQDEQNHIHPNVKGMTVIKDKFEEKVASITKYYNEAGVSVTKEEYEKSCGTGKITINNMDSNNQHLKGTKIKVIGTKGYSNTFTTTGSSLIVENLKYDTYKINVIESPEGYILVPEQSITLSGTNSNITTNIINKKNKIKISKVDSTGEKIVEGATLQLTDSEGNIVNICKDINGNKNVECTWISANTPYEIEGLSKGTYYLKEIKSPDGYVLNNEKVKIVIDEKTVEDSYEIGNKLNKIVISNLSADTKKQLEGITLQLHDSNGNIVKKCKDTKGNNNIECMWVSSNVPYEIRGLKKGTYYLVETKVPSGYQLNKQKVKFVVDGNKNIYEVEMIHQLEVFEVDVPDTLSAKSILLITIAMTLVAIGIGVIVYIKKYKVN